MSETASATMASTPLGGGVFQYTITLADTSNATGIGTFWFAWDDQPDADFLISQPSNVASPAGWTDHITHLGPSDGFGIQWVANAATNDVQPGASLQYSFELTDPPSQIFRPNAQNDINPGTSQLFDITSSFVYAGGPFSDTGFSFTVPCYCAGTQILTSAGQWPVEQLYRGTLLPTGDGRLARVRWVGRRRIDCRHHPRPQEVQPVRVRAGAFGPDLPHRDLLLSPDHAVMSDHVLVPIRHLINGVTVVQEAAAQVDYFHVALSAHAVLLAEGLPVESYLDTGNRIALSENRAFAWAALLRLGWTH